MMSTDSYMLAIREPALRHAADLARRACGEPGSEKRIACARRVVRANVCVCLLLAPEILKALEADLQAGHS